MSLTKYEQETVISFNKEEKVAYIFTYEKSWQQHLEKNLKLKPIDKNSHGGREYQIPKDRIKMPRAKKKVDVDALKARLLKNLTTVQAKN